MKKFLAIFLVLALSVGMFAACGDDKKEPEVEVEEPVVDAEEPQEEPEEVEEEVGLLKGDDSGIRTGVGVITTMDKSTDADEDGNGLGQVDSVVAAVLIDNDGKIINLKLDTAQNKINFNPEGVIVDADGNEITPDEITFRSKHELGDEYGMRVASEIEKEWNEQADAFVAFAIGKDINEIKGVSLSADGAPEGVDLEASVTMDVTGYIAAIEKAIEYAQELGADEADELGLGVVSTSAQSKNADEDEDGTAQAYSNYVAVTVNSDDVITSAVIESSQGNVKMSNEGAITSDKNEPKLSKRELGDEYGMRPASEIEKEWDEQSRAFADFITGKTLAEIQGVTVTEDGAPEGVDLEASVTMDVTGYITALEKAVANASAPASQLEEDVENLADDAAEVAEDVAEAVEGAADDVAAAAEEAVEGAVEAAEGLVEDVEEDIAA